jgi:4-hydroxy-tetrahydrodipicolinate synthase
VVDEALQYLLSDCIDMIFEQGNPAGIKQVFDSLGIADSFVRLPLVQGNSLSKRIDQFVKDG